jgi:hypothetical protein
MPSYVVRTGGDTRSILEIRLFASRSTRATKPSRYLSRRISRPSQKNAGASPSSTFHANSTAKPPAGQRDAGRRTRPAWAAAEFCRRAPARRQRLAPENRRSTAGDREYWRQRLEAFSLNPGKAGGSPTPGNHDTETGLAGWPCKTRTQKRRCAKYPFEGSHRLAGIQPNSGHREDSRLSCGIEEMQLGPSPADLRQVFCADVGHRAASLQGTIGRDFCRCSAGSNTSNTLLTLRWTLSAKRACVVITDIELTGSLLLPRQRRWASAGFGWWRRAVAPAE